MRKIYTASLFSVLLICLAFDAQAQDVDGFSIWENLTREQLVAKYGQPLKYEAHKDGEVFQDTDEFYEFKDIMLSIGDHYMYEFKVKSSKPRVMTKMIKGGFRLGDPESVLKPLEKLCFSREPLKDGTVKSYFLFEGESYLIVEVKDGIITAIWTWAKVV